MLTPAFFLMAFAIELTPGPNSSWLVLTTLTHGRRAGFAATAGIVLGLLLLGVGVALGVEWIADGPPIVMQALAWAGAAYLFWIAWETWPRGVAVASEPQPVMTAVSDAAQFRQGLILNLLNAKTALVFAAVLPNYVAAGADLALRTQLLILTSAYVGVATCVHILLVLLAGQIHAHITSPDQVRRVRQWAAVALVATALWLILTL